MKNIKIIIIVMLSILLCGCPEKYPNGHKYITIINNSDIEIGYYELIDWKDTFFCYSNSGRFGKGTTGIKPNDSFSFFRIDRHEIQPWELYLDRGQILSIWIVKLELMAIYWNTACDTIRKYVPILHCYKLTLEDLQRINWTVIYPPEEEKDED